MKKIPKYIISGAALCLAVLALVIYLAEECLRPVALCRRVGGMIPGVDQIIDVTKKLAEGGVR